MFAVHFHFEFEFVVCWYRVLVFPNVQFVFEFENLKVIGCYCSFAFVDFGLYSLLKPPERIPSYFYSVPQKY